MRPSATCSGADRPISGRLITFEGGEGAGKSTQLARLAEHLDGKVARVVRTREPGGTPAAEAIRALLVTGAVDRWDPISEAMLHIAARRDHVRRVIQPALLAESWVLCDRFTDSTRAYQGCGHGLGIELIDELHAAAIPDMAPDLTLILDVPVPLGLQRAVRRAADAAEQEARYEKMDHGFHERLRAGFLEIAEREPERCVVIDAAETPDTVFAAVRDAVTSRLAGTA